MCSRQTTLKIGNFRFTRRINSDYPFVYLSFPQSKPKMFPRSNKQCGLNQTKLKKQTFPRRHTQFGLARKRLCWFEILMENFHFLLWIWSKNELAGGFWFFNWIFYSIWRVFFAYWIAGRKEDFVIIEIVVRQFGFVLSVGLLSQRILFWLFLDLKL